MHVNSPGSADENQLKCEKVRFFKEMSENNSSEVIKFLSAIKRLLIVLQGGQIAFILWS